MIRKWGWVVVMLIFVGLGAPGDVAARVALPRVLSEDFCPPLPPPTGPTIAVNSESALRDQAYNAAAGTTLVIASGTYAMQGYVYIVNDGVSLRGQTDNRDDVILDFGGMVGGYFGILVDADDVTIANITIRNTSDHGVSIQGADRPVLYNLHILDTNDQLVKVNPLGDGSDDGLLACSRLAYTTSDPDGYTNGISAHNAHNWVVRDNVWSRIRTSDGSPAPTILFWSGSSGTLVERNVLVDCGQGIAFGNASHGPGDHTGGIVRNNFIYANEPHDVVIEMVHATGWLVAHNTALLLKPVSGLTWGMEARFSDSQGTFAYNLTNMAVWANRDGAQVTSTGNVTTATADWFVAPASGDLHLRTTATGAIDRAASLADVPADIDGDARPIGSAPDVGADEVGQSPPVAVTDLRIIDAVLDAGTLTATLRWTSPSSVVTATLRYASSYITEGNWAAATVLTETLPGGRESFLAAVSYSTGTRYFAHKSQNAAGSWSSLSNVAFWPRVVVYLPVVLRH